MESPLVLWPAPRRAGVAVQVAAGCEPQNLEPDKCCGWSWVTWSEMSELPASRLFVPLQNLLGGAASYHDSHCFKELLDHGREAP